jgi:polyphosphate kinase
VAPVESPRLQERLASLLRTMLIDNRQAWELAPDGEWRQRTPSGDVYSTHVALLADSWGGVHDAADVSSPNRVPSTAPRDGRG